MTKTILITGATDGIGLETARALSAKGHRILLHGRNEAKLEKAAAGMPNEVETYTADLADIAAVRKLADAVAEKHETLDVLINNAGVFKTSHPRDAEGRDIRFIVNTVSPYVLTKALLPLLGTSGRVVNLSSAAQAPMDIDALMGSRSLDDMSAYAQSKLGIAAWTQVMAEDNPDGPQVYAINPGSLLATKMVKEGFNMSGNDIGIGVDIISRAALSDEFEGRSGSYYDNDSGRFANPDPAARDPRQRAALMSALDGFL